MIESTSLRYLSPTEMAELPLGDALELSRKRARASRRREYRELLESMGVQGLDLRPDAVNAPPDVLIDGLLFAGTPGNLSGQCKGGKSSVLVDIAVCLSSREPANVLGHFPVHPEAQNTNVTIIDNDSSVSEASDRVRRIAAGRGVELNVDRLHIIHGLGPLDEDRGLSRLEKIVSHVGGGLLAIDCLYACLPNTDFNCRRAMGGVLAEITTLCRENYTTVLYVDHTKKTGRDSGLKALSGVGLDSHVGQWIALERIGDFAPETGSSKLRLEVGSRLGFCGHYTLDVIEGCRSDPGGRRWETTVTGDTAAAETDSGAVTDDCRVWQPPKREWESR